MRARVELVQRFNYTGTNDVVQYKYKKTEINGVHTLSTPMRGKEKNFANLGLGNAEPIRQQQRHPKTGARHLQLSELRKLRQTPPKRQCKEKNERPF